MGTEVDILGYYPTSMGWAKEVTVTCSDLLRCRVFLRHELPNQRTVGTALNHLIHSQVPYKLSYRLSDKKRQEQGLNYDLWDWNEYYDETAGRWGE
jgi:hypothetical protein